LHAILAADHLGLRDRACGTAVGKRSMQNFEVYARPIGMPVNDGRVFKVLAKNEVRLKEFPV
jgi:hypothetical protein